MTANDPSITNFEHELHSSQNQEINNDFDKDLMVVVIDHLPTGYSYNFLSISCPDSNVEEPENYIAEFRIKEVDSECAIYKWLLEFEKMTLCTWRKARTHKSGPLIISKMSYKCHHNTDSRFRKVGRRRHKNTNCRAKLQIVIKRHVQLTIGGQRPDPLTKDWPCTVVLYNVHNHEMESTETLRFRELGMEAKEILGHLYRKGHSVPSALQCLRMDYMFKYPEEIYYSVCADGHYMPTVSICHHLFKKFANQHKSCSSVISLIEDYNTGSSSGKASFSQCDNQIFVNICTSLMHRINHHLSCLENKFILVESYGFLDKRRPRVYLLNISTCAGYLPFAGIVSDKESEQVFENAIKKLSQDYPTIFPPSVTFLTDGDPKKAESLAKICPDAVVLQSRSYVCKSIWTWLTNKRNEIDGSHVEQLYHLSKNLILATSEDQTYASRLAVTESDIAQKYPRFLLQVDSIWTRQEECIRPQRSQIPSNMIHTAADCGEPGFNILKECIFREVKSFKFHQLVDFMLTKFDLFVQHWMMTFSLRKQSHSLVSKFLNQPFDMPELTIKDAGIKGCFYVQNSNEEFSPRHLVEIQIGSCTCTEGSFKLCKHIVGVLQKCPAASSDHHSQICAATQFLQVTFGEDDDNEERKSLTIQDEDSALPEPSLSCQSDDGSHNTVTRDADSPCHIPVNDHPRAGTTTITETECEQLLMEFDNKILSKIRKGVKSNPTAFVPALKRTLANFQETDQTDEVLLVALNSFAKLQQEQNDTNHPATAECQQLDNNYLETSNYQPKNKNRKVQMINSDQPQFPHQLRHHDYTSLSGPQPRRDVSLPD